jgi:hypothetical protein
MKTLLMTAIGVALFAMLAGTSVSALPAQGTYASINENVTAVRWRRNHRCTTERIVRRGHNGRRVVTTRRVCH